MYRLHRPSLGSVLVLLAVGCSASATQAPDASEPVVDAAQPPDTDAHPMPPHPDARLAPPDARLAPPDAPVATPDAAVATPDAGRLVPATVTVGAAKTGGYTRTGVIAGPNSQVFSDCSDVTAELQHIGVTTVRNNDYGDDRLDMESILNCSGTQAGGCPDYPCWEGCSPGPANEYFTSSVVAGGVSADDQMTEYVDGSFEPLLRLGNEASIATNLGVPAHAFNGPQNPTQEANWQAAALNVVARYKDWKTPGLVKYLDIWTEWPNSAFYDRSAADFIAFYKTTLDRLKTAYPELKIGGPGILLATGLIGGVVPTHYACADTYASSGQTNPALDFIEFLFKRTCGTPQKSMSLDWFGVHMFSNYPGDYHDVAAAARDLLDGTGPYTSVPWAASGKYRSTEVMVDAIAHNPRMNGHLYDPDTGRRLGSGKEGAALASAAWIGMSDAGATRTYIYRAHDLAQDAPCTGQTYGCSSETGVFYCNTTGQVYKPFAHAIRLWTSMASQFPQRRDTPYHMPLAGGGDLWALAGEGGGGRRALLVANTSFYPSAPALAMGDTVDASVTVAWADGFHPSAAHVYLVNDTSDGEAAVSYRVPGAIPSSFPLLAGEVILVIFDP